MMPWVPGYAGKHISYRLHFLWGATHRGCEMYFHTMWLEGLILTTLDLKTVEGPEFLLALLLYHSRQ